MNEIEAAIKSLEIYEKRIAEFEAQRKQDALHPIDAMCAEVHKIAVEKGWWENTDAERDFEKLLTPMHSELSEAYREWRDDSGNPYYSTTANGKPVGMTAELADCVIRIMDWFGAIQLSLSSILRRKIEYNKTRPYRHGGKRG